jgi:hypothetical protein
MGRKSTFPTSYRIFVDLVALPISSRLPIAKVALKQRLDVKSIKEMIEKERKMCIMRCAYLSKFYNLSSYNLFLDACIAKLALELPKLERKSTRATKSKAAKPSGATGKTMEFFTEWLAKKYRPLVRAMEPFLIEQVIRFLLSVSNSFLVQYLPRS